MSLNESTSNNSEDSDDDVKKKEELEYLFIHIYLH